MASNALPNQNDRLFTLAEDMADGLHAHEVAVGIQQNKEAKLRPDLTAALAKESAFQAKRHAKLTATAAQTVADSNGKAFIASAKRVLENYLGGTWSAAWAEAGFVNNSTAVPKTIAERQASLGALQTYFTAHANHQNVPLQVTAAKAGTFFTALSDKRSTVNDVTRQAGQAKAERDAAVKVLRTRMTGLVNELAQLLAKDDARWYAFGLSRPVDTDLPGIPDALVITPGAAGSGTAYADWADARRAVRYRLWKKVTGVDTDFVPVLTVTDSDATMTGLPVGATVEIRVIAVNESGGESQPSETKQIVVP